MHLQVVELKIFYLTRPLSSITSRAFTKHGAYADGSSQSASGIGRYWLPMYYKECSQAGIRPADIHQHSEYLSNSEDHARAAFST